MESHCLISTVFRRRIKLLRSGHQYLIGRGSEAAIILPSDIVSRAHAEVQGDEQGFTLEDLKSTNGTKVNGTLLAEKHRLLDDDLVQVGPFEIRYKVFNGNLDQFLEENVQSADETRRLARADLASPGELTGRFVRLELLEIIQLLELNQKDGRLQVRSGGEAGEILFERGQLVGATIDEEVGEPAAFHILSFESGEFTFLSVPIRKAEMNFRANPSRLIMEVLRLRDEQGTATDALASGSIFSFVDSHSNRARTTRTEFEVDEEEFPPEFLDTWASDD